MFAQVDRVEVDSLPDVVVGEVRLEEVVGVAVDVQHGAASTPARRSAPDERRDDRAFVVGTEIDGHLLVRLTQHVCLHTGRLPSRYPHAPLLCTDRT